MSLGKWLRGDYVDLNKRWQHSYQGDRLLTYLKIYGIMLLVIVPLGVANKTFNWGIGESPSFMDGSGYISINTSATANVFELKEVTSEFSVGNIITIGDSKKEHEITEVTELQKSKSGNSQSIILMEGVGFETNTGLKVSVVR